MKYSAGNTQMKKHIVGRVWLKLEPSDFIFCRLCVAHGDVPKKFLAMDTDFAIHHCFYPLAIATS